MSSSFLYNGTRRLYERLGFRYVRPKGLKNCVMSIEVAPPMLIDRPGRRLRRSAWMILRLAKSGSQCSLASSGACWPSAEKVIWLPRSSIR